MRKYLGIRAGIALTAAACMLFAGCKEKADQETADTDAVLTPAGGEEKTPDADGQTQGEGEQNTPDVNPAPKEEQNTLDTDTDEGGQILDISGLLDEDGEINLPEDWDITVVDSSEEERAKTEVVQDSFSDYLMYQGIYYELLDEETARIADYYDLEMTQLIIPDSIAWEGKNYRVTRVGEDVFSYYYDLSKIVIGNNVEVLEDNAFCGCSSLTEVVFGTGLKEIGAHAFEGCEELEEIVIPEGVTTIGEEAFCSCPELKRITLPEGLLVLGDNLFFDCESLERVSIPSSVASLPYGLFTNCTMLSQVDLPEGLTVIETEAFWACESLDSLTLPSSLVYIGDRAFYNCALKSITFPDKRISLGDGIFDFCDMLETIYVTEDTAGYYETELGFEYEFETVQ